MTQFKRKPAALILLTLLIVGGVALALMSRRSTAADDKKTTAPKPALTVTTTRPSQVSLPIALAANGNITAWQEAIIGSESNGLRLADVKVNVGDSVSAGQILAKFADDATAADVAQARAALAEAVANAADASANAVRARTVQDSGALSAQQVSQYLTTEQTAKAKVASAKATLDVQQLHLKHTQVVAPDSGIISARSATVGAVVPAGTELFRMIRQGRLEWRAEVISGELSRLAVGMPVSVVAANGNTLKGRVRMIAPTVDLQTRTALVYVDLLAASGKQAAAKAGMFARGEFELGKSSALTVPQQAVVVRDGFSYVFRLNADNRVSQVKVQPGRRMTDRVEILQGLTVDTPVVVSGAGFLNDGDLVKNVAAVVAPQ
jgi:RND family efflux transporter MFP subunit